MNRFSISLRLTVWFTALFVCGFVVFGIVMWGELAYSLSRGRDRTLMRRAVRAQEIFSTTPPGKATLRAERYREFAEGTPESNLVRVYDAGGRLFYPEFSAQPPDFPWPRHDWPAHEFYSNVRFQGREYRVLENPVVLPSERLLVIVGGQLQDNRQNLDHFAAGLAAAIPILLVVSALAGYFTSRRVLAPVDRITAAVRSISIGNLSERLPIRHTGDELERLAETCNDMLARLEAAVVQIKRFTADASHELRSPLSYISMVAEEALRHPHSRPEDQESFEGILAESHEATRLLEDMLLIARADAGHVDIPFEHIDLTALVKEVFERARIPAEAKRQRLSLDCCGGTCEIRGNRSSLQRLIWALLDNAVKYTGEGGRVEVRLKPDGSHASLSVHDTGVGIAAPLLPRVFERFFRADPARSQGGTGLGLAIAKWIADVHHATLSVESALGVGSTFTAVFPLESQAAAVLRPAS